MSPVIWCWVAAEVDMQRPAHGVKDECFSGAFLLMQKKFLETVFFILLNSQSQNLSSGVSPSLLQLLNSS